MDWSCVKQDNGFWEFINHKTGKSIIVRPDTPKSIRELKELTK